MGFVYDQSPQGFKPAFNIVINRTFKKKWNYKFETTQEEWALITSLFVTMYVL